MLHKGEIRHLILIALLILMLGVLCVGSQIYLDYSCGELLALLTGVNSQNDLDHFDREFDRITDVWLLMLPHSEIDRLSEAYFHMYSAPPDAFDQEKQVLIHFLQMMPDRMKLSIENIL